MVKRQFNRKIKFHYKTTNQGLKMNLAVVLKCEGCGSTKATRRYTSGDGSEQLGLQDASKCKTCGYNTIHTVISVTPDSPVAAV